MRVSLVLAVLALTACSGVNSQTNSYATLAEAQQAGAIAHGWIPTGLPATAHDLREGHVPGSNARWGIFEYPAADEKTVQALLEPSELAVNGQECRVPSRIEWWPLMLRGPLDADRLSTTGVRVYRGRTGDLLFAINWRQGRAYYCTL